MGKPDAERPRAARRPARPARPSGAGVVVPDDASALADEAARSARELRRPPATAGGGSPPPARPRPAPLAGPAACARSLTTLAGLVTVTWPRASRGPTARPPPPRSPPATLDRPAPARTGPGRRRRRAGPAARPAARHDHPGRTAAPAPRWSPTPPPPRPRRLRGHRHRRPRRSAPPTDRPPAPAAPWPTPAGGLRSFLHQPARPGAATALLVDRAGTVTRVLPDLGRSNYRELTGPAPERGSPPERPGRRAGCSGRAERELRPRSDDRARSPDRPTATPGTARHGQHLGAGDRAVAVDLAAARRARPRSASPAWRPAWCTGTAAGGGDRRRDACRTSAWPGASVRALPPDRPLERRQITPRARAQRDRRRCRRSPVAGSSSAVRRPGRSTTSPARVHPHRQPLTGHRRSTRATFQRRC